MQHRKSKKHQKNGNVESTAMKWGCRREAPVLFCVGNHCLFNSIKEAVAKMGLKLEGRNWKEWGEKGDTWALREKWEQVDLSNGYYGLEGKRTELWRLQTWREMDRVVSMSMGYLLLPQRDDGEAKEIHRDLGQRKQKNFSIDEIESQPLGPARRWLWQESHLWRAAYAACWGSNLSSVAVLRAARREKAKSRTELYFYRLKDCLSKLIQSNIIFLSTPLLLRFHKK